MPKRCDPARCPAPGRGDRHRDRTLTLTPDTDGAGGYLRARLHAVGYATLAAYRQAATAPKVAPDGDPTCEPRPDADTRHLGQRRHDALVEAARQMLAGATLPSSGGVKPCIVLHYDRRPRELVHTLP